MKQLIKLFMYTFSDMTYLINKSGDFLKKNTDDFMTYESPHNWLQKTPSNQTRGKICPC